MIFSLKLLGLVALLFLGSWGWGTAAVGLFRRWGWKSVREELGPTIQILLGVALFLAVGGFLVALDSARIGPLVAWHVIGVALLVTRVRIRRKTNEANHLLPLSGLVVACVGIVLTLIALGIAIGIPAFNQNDDDPGYIYLAKRLSATGGLLDPFNLRRMTDYGGATLYQSMFLRISGTSSTRGFELVFGALLLVMVAIQTTRRRWLAVGALVLGIGVVLGNGIGHISNLSPNFSIAALSLGVFQVLRLVRNSDQRDEPLLYVVIGVLLAGILALRFSYLLSVVVAVVIVVLVLRGRRAVKPILIIGITGIVCSAGWALALLRSSRSPMFPLIAGNYNTSWPTGQNPAELTHGLGTFARFIWLVFATDNVGWIAVAAVLAGLTFLALSHGASKGALVLLAGGLGCLVQIAAYAYSLSGSNSLDIVRLIAPSTLACGLFALGLLWPLKGPEDSDSFGVLLSSWNKAKRESGARHSAHRALPSTGPTVAIALLSLGGAALIFGYSLTNFAHSTRADLKLGSQVLDGTYAVNDIYHPYESEYRQLNAMIPQGARVLAAVDRPALLSFTKYEFATLDVVGAVSPPPQMPYFTGPMAKVDYLRRLGYQYIVADSMSRQGLYNLQIWYDNLTAEVYVYRQWTPYFLDWESTVNYLEKSHRFDVRYAGSLALIRIG